MKRLLALPLLLLALPAPANAQLRDLYVSVGDSYAAGYQPTSQTTAFTTRNGFPNQLMPLARAKGYRNLKLANFACGRIPPSGGETTTSFMSRRARCLLPAPGGVRYSDLTQLQGAERYLRRNRRRIAFVTVSLGGNDVTACVRAPDVVKCVTDAAALLRRNITTIGRRLRRAAGPSVPIIGGTYPDVLLGLWVSGRKEDQDLARLSVVGFQSIVNPALRQSYARNRIRFADVTAYTGAYGSLDQTTTIPDYGTVPVPVARVCELTFYCQWRDIHARTNGYKAVAEAYAAQLPRARRR